MKVTFTCEKCGHIMYEVGSRESGDTVTVSGDCPNCHAPTYGTLTEEMLAEFLCNCAPCSAWEDWTGEEDVEFSKDDFRAMAGGVIRLLGQIAEVPPWPFSGTPTDCENDNWRGWLLDLASRK